MTKYIIPHPRQGQTHKKIALRMTNGAIHRDDKGSIVRFRTADEARHYAHIAFVAEKQPSITVLV